MPTAHLRFRLLPAILCVIACAACGESSASLSPTGPTRSNGARNGAVISGRVSGVGLSPSTIDATTASSTSTTLRVTIMGTNISTMVDGTGQFTLNGVPPGTVTITFTGDRVSASITLNNVAVGDEIRIDVRLNGNSARVESENRGRRDDDEDDDDDEANEVEGVVSGLTGTCPALAFAVGTRVVITNSATRFDDPCSSIRNGVRIEARGSTTQRNAHRDTSGDRRLRPVPLAPRIGITFHDVVSQLPEASMAATETLLVVENEAAIRALVKMALERQGYTVLSAESGSEALSLAAAHQGRIDLLITDVVMPDLRGPDLARRFVAERPRADHALHVRLHGRCTGRRDQVPASSCRLHPETLPAQCARRQGATSCWIAHATPASSTHDTSHRSLPRACPGVGRRTRHPHDRPSPRSQSRVSSARGR